MEKRARAHIRVLIADDNEMMCIGLQSCLRGVPDITVVGTAGNGVTAIETVARLAVDVVLMDVFLPVLDGVETCRVITTQCPNTRVLMLSANDDLRTVRRAFAAGARGFLIKDGGSQDVASSIRLAHLGGTVVAPEIFRRLNNATADGADVVAPSGN